MSSIIPFPAWFPSLGPSHSRPLLIFRSFGLGPQCSQLRKKYPTRHCEILWGLGTWSRHFLFSSTRMGTEGRLVPWLQLCAFRVSNPSVVPLSSRGNGSGERCLSISQLSLIVGWLPSNLPLIPNTLDPVSGEVKIVTVSLYGLPNVFVLPWILGFGYSKARNFNPLSSAFFCDTVYFRCHSWGKSMGDGDVWWHRRIYLLIFLNIPLIYFLFY